MSYQPYHLPGSSRVEPSARDGLASVPLGYVLAAGILLVAALLRVSASITYSPALMWDDSWQYVFGTSLPGGFTIDKPNGYMLFLRVLGSGHHLALVTFVNHLLGLAGGVLLFLLMRRQGVGSIVAALAMGVVLLDAYAIALEQHVLAEALFAFLLVLWAFCAITRPRNWQWAVVAGVVLVAVISVRAAGIFVVPVWIVFAMWAYRGWLPRVAAVAAVVVGVVGIAAWHDAKAGGFGLNQMSGWQLYGRVAEMADCAGRSVPESEQSLCPPAELPSDWADPYSYALFSPDSPVNRTFGSLYDLPTNQRLRADARLRAFSRDAILDRPLTFLGLIARDTTRYAIPGRMSFDPSYDDAITFPREPQPLKPVESITRDAFSPGYEPPPANTASFLPAYGDWAHTPRWLMALLFVAGLVAIVLRASSRLRAQLEHGPATLLLTGAGFSLLLGSSLNHFEVRYLIPAVPLLVGGGVIATCDLVRAYAGLRQSRAPGSEPSAVARV